MYAQALRVSRQALTYIPVQPAVYSPPPPPPHPSTTPTLATLVLFLLVLAARWVAPLLGGRILCSYPVKAVIPFLPDDLLGGMFGKALRSAGRLGGKGVLSRHGDTRPPADRRDLGCLVLGRRGCTVHCQSEPRLGDSFDMLTGGFANACVGNPCRLW